MQHHAYNPVRQAGGLRLIQPNNIPAQTIPHGRGRRPVKIHSIHIIPRNNIPFPSPSVPANQISGPTDVDANIVPQARSPSPVGANGAISNQIIIRAQNDRLGPIDQGQVANAAAAAEATKIEYICTGYANNSISIPLNNNLIRNVQG